MDFISFKKCNKHYKYMGFAAVAAFLTNFIFGYIYNENMDMFKLIDNDNQILLSAHIIYHYIFRFLGILIFSIFLYRNERKTAQEINKSKNNLELNYLDLDLNKSSGLKLIYKDIKKQLNMSLDISPLEVFIIITFFCNRNYIRRYFL